MIQPVKDSAGHVLAAKGAIAVGRIVRVEQRFRPATQMTISIRFDHIEANGASIPVTLVSMGNSNPREQIARIVEFGKIRVRIPSDTILHWQTR